MVLNFKHVLFRDICPQDYNKHFINFKNDMITSNPWNSCQVTAVISAPKRTTNDRDMNWAVQSRFILPIKKITSGEIKFGLQSRCNEILAIKLKIWTISSHLKLISWGELLHPQPKAGAGCNGSSAGCSCCTRHTLICAVLWSLQEWWKVFIVLRMERVFMLPILSI